MYCIATPLHKTQFSEYIICHGGMVGYISSFAAYPGWESGVKGVTVVTLDIDYPTFVKLDGGQSRVA